MDNEEMLAENDEVILKSIAFFIPIEVNNYKELMRKIRLISRNTELPNKVMREIIFEHDLQEFDSFYLYHTEWKYVLTINVEKVNNEFQRMDINIYRLSEAFIVMTVILYEKDSKQKNVEIIGRKKFTEISTKEKDGFTYHKTSEDVQKETIEKYLQAIEKLGLEFVYSYFQEIIFFSNEIHIPAIRIFYIKKNDNEGNAFWTSIGYGNGLYESYANTSNEYLLSHDMTANWINLFIEYTKIEPENSYGSLDIQIDNTLKRKLYPSIGPGLVASEIYNLLYKKYRSIMCSKGYLTAVKNQRLINDFMYYINKVNLSFFSSKFFDLGAIELRQINRGPNKNECYAEKIKRVVTTKMGIMKEIYQDVNGYISNRNSIVLNFRMLLLTIFALLVSIVSLLK